MTDVSRHHYSEEQKEHARHFIEERMRKTGRSAIRSAIGLSGFLALMFVVGHFVSLLFPVWWVSLTAFAAVAAYLQIYAWIQSSAVVEREIVDTNLTTNDNLVSAVPGVVILLGWAIRPLLAYTTTGGNYLSLLEWLVTLLAAMVILKDLVVNGRAAQKIALLTDELAKVK